MPGRDFGLKRQLNANGFSHTLLAGFLGFPPGQRMAKSSSIIHCRIPKPYGLHANSEVLTQEDGEAGVRVRRPAARKRASTQGRQGPDTVRIFELTAEDSGLG